MSQTPGDQEPTTALRHLHADTPRNGTLTLTLRRKSPRHAARAGAFASARQENGQPTHTVLALQNARMPRPASSRP
jgi:hypothetical protein